MRNVRSVRGTYDLYGENKRKVKQVILEGSKIVEKYGFEEIETPIIEFTEIFSRNLGDTSDIVTKEMYSFEDRGGDSLTLRPEGTAGVVRAVISNNMQQNLPIKLYYSGPMFRYERPQKGRQRQFTQFGVELLGVESAQADIEVIAMAYEFIESLGLSGMVSVEINSLGDKESRDIYREKLVAYLKQNYDSLSEESKKRIERNPLRVLDSKENCDKEIIANAPLLRDSLNEKSKILFNTVLNGLNALNINYRINDRLVRGLDYYSNTVFEITTDKLGAQGTVLAGGRYDGLVEQMGGCNIPGIGWACGVERLISLLKKNVSLPRPIAVIPIGEGNTLKGIEISYILRKAGFRVDQAYSGNIKKRMLRANKINAYKAVILGEDELLRNEAAIKDLDTGEQKIVPLDNLIMELK